MATKRYYSCGCGPKRCWSLFDALRDFKSRDTQKCKVCGKRAELHLVLPFGLGAGSPDCTVFSVFAPSELEYWLDKDGKRVTFFPFLVILKRNNKLACWQPYWHVKYNKKKYGQWASFMSKTIFQDLLLQARKAGYLR